ncbi:hypothetical protein QBE52_16550 [Clostridiaceae bacterium 35-E11]
MNKREKIMLYMILILLTMVSVKSLFLDEVKNLTRDEQQIKQFIKEAVEEESQYNGFLQKKHLATYRVVSIKKVSEDGNFPVFYYDKERKEQVQKSIPGKYVIKIRGYLFHIIPYKEFRIKS